MSKRIESRQVSWWDVHTFVAPLLESVADRDVQNTVKWPLLGTPAWCSLDDSDPLKWAALLDAAQHCALRWETTQQAYAEASHDVAAAADWSAIASRSYNRAAFYQARPWLKRVVA
jgi:hypothetical protein